MLQKKFYKKSPEDNGSYESVILGGFYLSAAERFILIVHPIKKYSNIRRSYNAGHPSKRTERASCVS